MSSITWKYVKPLKDVKVIEKFLQENDIHLPEDTLVCMKNNNSGRPNRSIFDTDKAKERVFKAFLSLNSEDKENIYGIYSDEFKDRGIFPFATDPAGNFICVDLMDNNKIIFYNHENSDKEYISSSCEELFGLLYEI